MATGSFERSGLGPNTQIGGHLGVNKVFEPAVFTELLLVATCWWWPHEPFSVPIDNAAVYSQYLRVWLVPTVGFEQSNHVKSDLQVLFLDSLSLSGIIDRRYSMHKSSATQNRKTYAFSHSHSLML